MSTRMTVILPKFCIFFPVIIKREDETAFKKQEENQEHQCLHKFINATKLQKKM